MSNYLHLTKSYESPFVLDQPKLARLSSVLSRMGAVSYIVHFKTGKQLNLSTIEEVTALDNARSNPITKVELASGIGHTAVSFDSRPMMDTVRLAVLSEDNKTGNELYGELDEQVDRTLIKSLASRVSTIGTRLIVTGLLIAATYALVSVALPSATTVTQSFESVALSHARSAVSDHDKLQVIFEKTVHDLEPLKTSSAERPRITVRALERFRH